MSNQNSDNKTNSKKPKDRLIAQMVSAVMWSVATFNLVTGGVSGIQADILQDKVDKLEQEKAYISAEQLPEIEAEVAQLNNKIDQKVDFLIPSVYSFFASGTLGFAASSYLALKDSKESKTKVEDKNENTL